jgi:predicted nucleic-acid-binding Zn-ribbon protein
MTMATTTCLKCGNTSFELKETPVAHAIYRLYFVQCGKCGCAIGVQEYFNVGALIKRIESSVRKIAAALKVQIEAPGEPQQGATEDATKKP